MTAFCEGMSLRIRDKNPAPDLLNAQGSGGRAWEPRRESQSRRVRSKPQGGAWGNDGINRQDGNLIGVLSLYGNTHAAPTPRNNGEHVALHNFYPSESPRHRQKF